MPLLENIRRPYWRLNDLLIARTILSGTVAALGLLFLQNGAESAITWSLVLPVILIFLTNLPFFLFARRGAQRAVSWGMVVADVAFVTFLVLNTAGSESAVAVFYLWPIIAASLLLGPRASYLVAALSAAVYLALAVAQAGGWEPQDFLASQGISAVEGLDAVLVRVMAFLLIALLSGMLSNALLHSNAELLEAKNTLERELRQMKLANRRLVILDEVGRSLGRIQDLQVLLPRALARLASFMNVDAGMIGIAGREPGEVRILARQNLDEVVARNLFQAGLPTVIDDIQEYVVGDGEGGRYAATLRQLEKEGFNDFLAAPLRLADEHLGTLYLFTRPPHRFRKSDVGLLRSLTAQLSIAIKNVLFTKELKEANEELLHLDQLKSDFLATMSHELRTPLTSIIGYSDMLLSGMTGEMSDRQKDFVRNILNNGENLLNLINDILDLTKIEAGKLELNVEPINLQQALRGVLSTVTPKAKEKNIQLQVFLPNGLPPLGADSAKLGQILLNLLSNAIKYTPENGRVMVEARPKGEFVEIRVVDTGVGIEEADLERIFDRFTQVDSSSTRNQGGTGLGLAITRDLIELHGGTIRVQSTPGKGSSFIFTIPQAARRSERIPAVTTAG
ncbi:MAG: hypothetical protein Kow00129_15740 [Thermoleophilia bacterium]